MDDLGFKPLNPAAEPVRAPAAADDLGFQPLKTQEQAPISHAPPEVRGDADLGFKPVATAPSEEEKAAKYGTEGQLALGLAEKFAKGVVPSPLVTSVEKFFGVSPEEMKGREEYLGGYGTAAEMAGFAAGMFLPLGYGNLLGKVGQTALKAAGMAEKAGEAAKALTLGEKVARGVITQVPEMAAYSAVNEIDKYMMDKPQTASSVIADIGLNSVLGGAFGAGLPLAGAAIKAPISPILKKAQSLWNRRTRALDDGEIVGPVARKIIRVFGGVADEDVNTYIAERQKVLAMPEFMEISESMGDGLAKIYENLAEKKIGTKEAKAQLDQTFKNTMNEFKSRVKDSTAARVAAEDLLAEQAYRVKKELEQEVVESTAPRIIQALEKLQTSRNTLSRGARQILQNTPGNTSLVPFITRLDEMIANRQAATDTITRDALKKYRNEIVGQYGMVLPYQNAKDVLQTLQSKGQWNTFQTAELNAPSRYFEELSSILNNQVKEEVPAYAQEMLPTAEAAELFSKLSSIKDLPAAQRVALSLNNAKANARWMPLLKDLEKLTGVNFIADLNKYTSPEYVKALEQSLPQFAKTQKLIQLENSLKDPETRAAIEKAINFTEESAALKTAKQQEGFAKESVESLEGIGPKNIEAKMRKAMAGNETAIRQLKRIGIVNVPNVGLMTLPEVLRLIKVRESFEKGAKNGSRNVYAFSKIGETTGAAIGTLAGYLGFPEHGLLGAAGAGWLGHQIGTVLGAAADVEAPAWVKWYLDKQLDKRGDLSRLLGLKNPEDAKTAFIQIVGKNKNWVEPFEAKSFKSTAEFIEKQKKGEQKLMDGARLILGPLKVLPKELKPDPQKAKETDEKAKEFQDNPQKLIDLTSALSPIPEYSAQLASDVGRIVGLINQYRPKPTPGAFFDAVIEPSSEDKRMFQVGLEFADQPLTIYGRIKNNNLLPQDVQMFQALHPEMYQTMKKNILEAMIEDGDKAKKVPYQLRQSLSLFLGVDLDGSLNPQTIQAAQSVFAMQKMQAPAGAPASKTKALAKTSHNYETPMQASEMRKREG